MSTWHHYPHVRNLGHKEVEELLNGEVLVQEKIDGSQFSFGLVDHELRVRSRGREFDPHGPDNLFSGACEHVLSVTEQLFPGWTYRAEVLQKPKQNALAYDRTPMNHIALFDIEIKESTFADVDLLCAEAIRLHVSIVPTLYLGPGELLTYEKLEGWLQRESFLGGQKIEGMVIKNYERFTGDSKVMMGKYVRKEFRELARQAQPKQRKEIEAYLLEVYKTEARWHKALQHLKERGNYQGAMQDMPALMAEVCNDLLEEEGDAIKEKLLGHYWPKLSRGMTRGLAEWLKEQLAKEQFK